MPLVSTEQASPEAAAILDETQRAIGMVPNMYRGMANYPALLRTYSYGYNLFRSTSGFSPVEQEVVFLTIARENSCAYCMAAHSMVADQMQKMPADALAALREGRQIGDSRLASLQELTRLLTVNRGMIERADVERFLAAGFAESQVLAVLLAIGVKIFSNYSNHVLATPVDDAFSGYAWTKAD